MDSKPEQDYLVCAPATACRAVPGSTFDRHCSRCRKRVMVAPSGQKWLKMNPAGRLLCMLCYDERRPEDGGRTMLAGTAAEVLAELESAAPNPWRNRN